MEVVDGAKAIFNKGLVEAGEGNVSIRNGKKEEFFITSFGGRLSNGITFIIILARMV